MKFTIKHLTIVFIALFFTSCIENKTCKEYCSKLKKNDSGQTIVRLQQQWFPNSGFAGELFAQDLTGPLNGLDIQIISGSDMIDTKQVVKLNEAEFGVAGAEQIMQANEKGANLVVIGVINYKSLACFISKKEKNIKILKDLETCKVGTMEGSPVDLIYQVLKKKENLSINKKNEVPTGWVLTGFERDLYDVYPAFINDEPVKLKLQGVELNIIYPSSYDVNFIGTVYFCKRELVDCCPEIVQKFVNAIAYGWELALANPDKSISLLMNYDKSLDKKKELNSLISGIDYFKGENNKILYTKEETWNKMANQLIGIGQLNSFDYNSTVDFRFVTWYLSKVKPMRDEDVEK